MNINKNKIQEEALSLWKDNKQKGTLVVGTGVGKTKIGLMAVFDRFRCTSEPSNFSALIIVPTTNLRSVEWINEIERWYPELKDYITIECIQTAYKKTYKADIIVVDEIHTTLSLKYRKFYNSIETEALIGLTATEPHIEEYGEFLKTVCPVIYTLVTSEAQDLDIVSKANIFNIKVSFNRKEAAKYRSYTNMFTKAMMTLSKYGNSFEIASKYKSEKGHILQKTCQMFWTGMSLRKWTCYKAESKLNACVDIIKNIERDKWIIFCQHTDFADSLADELRALGIMAVSYHSKLKKKDREIVLENAKSKFCKVICSAQALNTGYNLPDIDSAICTASTGTELTFVQTRGRIIRLNDNKKDKVALFINLYVKDTQEYTWIKNKLDTKSLEFDSVLHFIKTFNNMYK